MGLPQTLKDFDEALREVARVLENFQEPVVFTPVPMKRVLKSQTKPPMCLHNQSESVVNQRHENTFHRFNCARRG
jgi:hypothetical protein